MLILSEEKINFLAPILTILLVFFIPISSTIKSILFVICCLTILLTPYYRQYLYYTFFSFWSCTGLMLFLYIVLATTWSEAPFSMRFNGAEKYSKLVFLPVLTVVFIKASTRNWVLNSYIAVMILTCILSLLKSKNLISLNTLDPGEVFYNHIVTSFMVAVGVYLALLLAFNIHEKKYKRIYYTLMVLLGSYQIIFINTGRSGYIAYSFLIPLFILQKLPLKKAMLGIGVFISIIVLSYFISPVMQFGTNTIANEIQLYRKNNIHTSLGLRMKFHQYAQDLFKEHPLVGIGTGGFQFRYLKDKPIPGLPKLKEPHGQYWLILAEGGGIGILLYFIFLGALYFTGLRLKETKAIFIGVFSVFCILSFSDTIFCYSTPGYLLILFSAICFGELLEKNSSIPGNKKCYGAE